MCCVHMLVGYNTAAAMIHCLPLERKTAGAQGALLLHTATLCRAATLQVCRILNLVADVSEQQSLEDAAYMSPIEVPDADGVVL